MFIGYFCQAGTGYANGRSWGFRPYESPGGDGMAMEGNSIDNRRKIISIIEELILNKIEIKVRIKGQKDPFISRFIKLAAGSDKGKGGRSPEKETGLIMEKLDPAEGNSLIQSSPDVEIECVAGEKSLHFRTRYSGISSDYPYFGIILELPDAVSLKQKRREERFVFSTPEFISVEFKLEKKSEKSREFELNVLDCSSHGLGLLVTEKDEELVQTLNSGDHIKNMTFYAEWAMIKVDVTVRHKTRIGKGKHKGRYIIGVESREIIDSCKPSE